MQHAAHSSAAVLSVIPSRGAGIHWLGLEGSFRIMVVMWHPSWYRGVLQTVCGLLDWRFQKFDIVTLAPLAGSMHGVGVAWKNATVRLMRPRVHISYLRNQSVFTFERTSKIEHRPPEDHISPFALKIRPRISDSDGDTEDSYRTQLKSTEYIQIYRAYKSQHTNQPSCAYSIRKLMKNVPPLLASEEIMRAWMAATAGKSNAAAKHAPRIHSTCVAKIQIKTRT